MSTFDRVRALHLSLAVLVLVSACGSDGTSAPTQSPSPQPTTTPEPAPVADFDVTGSVEQVYLVGATPGTELQLVDADGSVVQTGTADDNGTLIYRHVAAAAGYRVEAADGSSSPAFEVKTADDVPSQDFYSSQEINAGYGYLETRDGTLLAYNVMLPGDPEDGPYPTVVEYSGYDPANLDAPQPSSLIASVLGYAVVGVNMRGTGCSGGTFEFFETLQTTDGYDAIEAIAAQPWVMDNEVGMVGLSYPGISQLFVAWRQPPSLIAIAPLSVVSDTGRGTLRPGGILNNGFAISWSEDRRRDAMVGGQGWSQKRLDEGDQVCIDNMLLRGQTPDILQIIAENEFYVPAVADPVSPVTFVDKIQVPTYLAGAFNDEQTGGYFANMVANFTGTDQARFTMVNGAHTDPFGPEVFSRWMEFLDLYVGKKIPARPGSEDLILDVLRNDIFRVEALPIEAERYDGVATYEEALAQWEAEPRVRILFDNGAGDPAVPGAPYPGFEMGFKTWPAPEMEPTTWYFGAGGALTESAPSGADGADSFVYDATLAQKTTLSSGSSWEALPAYEWAYRDEGTFLSYTSAPLADDVVMAGSGSADLWLMSDAADTDIQVSLTEVRPDGVEYFIQNGWLRASRRHLDAAASTDIRPVSTHLLKDAKNLPGGEFSLVRVEIFPFAHPFRAGSQIRLYVEAPGATRTEWRWEALEFDGEVVNTVARVSGMASSVVLPVIPDVEIPTPLPACPSLRGLMCRIAQ
ncbi:MAG: CocE/NonD family hydrolase [Candidatus Binatia bacterium]|nr:CocE/NonD family hydrolase [Candidatus Binatia bacterium]